MNIATQSFAPLQVTIREMAVLVAGMVGYTVRLNLTPPDSMVAPRKLLNLSRLRVLLDCVHPATRVACPRLSGFSGSSRGCGAIFPCVESIDAEPRSSNCAACRNSSFRVVVRHDTYAGNARKSPSRGSHSLSQADYLSVLAVTDDGRVPLCDSAGRRWKSSPLSCRADCTRVKKRPSGLHCANWVKRRVFTRFLRRTLWVV